MTRLLLISLATVVVCTGATAQPYAYPPGYYQGPPPGYYQGPIQDFFTPQPLPPRAPYRGVYPNPYYQGGPRAFGEPAKFCQKLCLQDFAPCDPAEFKRADGRCTNPNPRF